MRLCKDIVPCSDRLREILKEIRKPGDGPAVVHKMYVKNLFSDFIDTLDPVENAEDFIFDMWVPAAFHEKFANYFEQIGYRPFFAGRKLTQLVPADFKFDPQLYLNLHPDVKKARIDPYRHYLEYGIFEGRRIK